MGFNDFLVISLVIITILASALALRTIIDDKDITAKDKVMYIEVGESVVLVDKETGTTTTIIAIEKNTNK